MSENQRPVAVVTGGTRGIGLGIARDLADTHHVVVGGRNPDAVQRVVSELPSASPFVADLADITGSLEPALHALVAATRRVDVLVHSAGVLHRGTIAHAPVADWAESMTVNVVAVAAVTKALLPALRATKGLVLMVNSGSGLTASPTMAAYSASKFALKGMADALRLEERPHGVRVTSLHPGRTDTDMQRQLVAWDGEEYDPDLFLTIESVVRAARTAIDASPEASIDLISIRPSGRR